MNDLYLRYMLELAMVFPAAIMAYMPVHDRLRFKKSRTYPMVAIMLMVFVGLGGYACVHLELSAVAALIPFAFLCLEVYNISVDVPLMKRLFCFLLAVMLTMFSMIYTNYLMAPLEPEGGPRSLQAGIVCIGIGFLLIILYSRTLKVKLPYVLQEDRFNKSWTFLNVAILLLCLLFYYINPETIRFVMVGRVRPIALLSLPVFIITFWLLFHIFWWTASQLKESDRIRQENTVLNMEEKRYNELRNYMDETRTLRHDFRQHMRVVTELAEREEYEELKDYLSQFSDVLDRSYKPYCANRVVDALAAHYDSMAEEQKTTIEWMLELPKELPISETDYCSMLGNLLENALYATEKEPEDRRMVRVISSMITEGMMGINVENPFSGKVRFNREGLPISKRPGHGIGLASVDTIVKRYNGTLNITAKNMLFSVNIMLYPHPESGTQTEQTDS